MKNVILPVLFLIIGSQIVFSGRQAKAEHTAEKVAESPMLTTNITGAATVALTMDIQTIAALRESVLAGQAPAEDYIANAQDGELPATVVNALAAAREVLNATDRKIWDESSQDEKVHFIVNIDKNLRERGY